MAATIGKGSHTAKSTGQVTQPEIVEVTQPADNTTNTGVVETPDLAQPVVADWHGAAATIRYPNPGPVTMSVSWLPPSESVEVPDPAKVETKVVGPKDEKKSKADPSPIAETK